MVSKLIKRKSRNFLIEFTKMPHIYHIKYKRRWKKKRKKIQALFYNDNSYEGRQTYVVLRNFLL